MSAFSKGVGGFIGGYVLLVIIGTVLGFYGVVPDPVTYWKWVAAVILLAAIAFAIARSIWDIE